MSCKKCGEVHGCNHTYTEYVGAKVVVDLELKARKFGVLYRAIDSKSLKIASEALGRCVEVLDEDCCMRHRGERTETNTDMVCGCKGD